jgi:hypothetical protein
VSLPLRAEDCAAAEQFGRFVFFIRVTSQFGCPWPGHRELSGRGALAIFAIAAVAGFRFNLWWVAAGVAGRSVFDRFHGRLVTNPPGVLLDVPIAASMLNA